VGFVGAGRMGLPMVERLAAADTDLPVLARRAEVRDALGTAANSQLVASAVRLGDGLGIARAHCWMH